MFFRKFRYIKAYKKNSLRLFNKENTRLDVLRSVVRSKEKAIYDPERLPLAEEKRKTKNSGKFPLHQQQIRWFWTRKEK